MSVRAVLSPLELEEPERETRSGLSFLEARALVKRFFGVTVLDGIALALRPGEVRALLGENGAGKSTLINLLSGVHQPDDGEILFDQQAVHFAQPLDANRAGISVIRQELSLFPDLTVAEAIFAGHLPRNRFGLVDWRSIREQSRSALELLGLTVIDVNARVAELSIAQQQLVEIARALTRQSRVVIMDEPTASLSQEEVEHLGKIIARLSAEGVAILYVSHRLDEIRAFCQTYTVLRDGRIAGEGNVSDVETAVLIKAMAGRDVEIGKKPTNHAAGRTVLEVKSLASRLSGRLTASVKDVSFTVRAGEIIGLAGIVGAGRTEVARMIFGLDAMGGGEIFLAGKPFKPTSVEHAIKAGIGYVSEDRKGLSILPGRSVLENFAIASAVKARFGILNDSAGEQRALEHYVERLGIRFPGFSAPIVTLSGGNQQKVILARWIARSPQLLIVDEPTRGIDLGAKEEVHGLLREIAQQGVAVLVISSDLPELMAVSHRIVTLCEGRSTFETDAANVTAEILMSKMTRV
ncbi:sugar ABC transporter ATP-binding protein [Ochrobactrum quorumnocens]|jgi:inositol transport system ATP-binding protein|uniref:Sugar ABC transporter ATP-binding protein n=1 Tax=Ochrobactrum quorumnocens TaxID=271865 RepID=A0A5N1JW36_9HYPH|nr:sugar ABC transporter ATP-binding protein [[Ochrobactrum] quorumnocens]KAA9367418.1 sugar ABC transporter ATP-binding protein [[Ochrobactrum] quorumnocens]